MKKRVETDSIGSMELPEEAYYGVQSLRAFNNFNITGRKMHKLMIISLAEIKKAAAITNRNSGLLDSKKANAIIKACDEIINGKFHDQFIIDPIQGGAGTSANMNANEVIANRAIELSGGTKGNYAIVHPNDDVNMCQSTNDVFPTAGKMTALKLIPNVISELQKLYTSLELKSIEFDDVVKMGRTQLQDAVPMTLGQSFHSYSSAIKRDIDRLIKVQDEIRIVNMGATAIGTGINTTPYYMDNIVSTLNIISKLNLSQATDLIDGTQNIDCFVVVSGILKSSAVNLSKMANDLRLLSSGPKTGIAEIILPAKQNGSSIMPGKINPVIPEVVSQVAFNIIGNDATITMAAEAGQLELNPFEPVLFYNLFESIETLASAINTFEVNCVSGIKANKERCKELVENSVSIVTALCPYLGYKKSASIAKESLKTGVLVRNIVLKEGLMSEQKLNEVLNILTMTQSIRKLKVS